MHAADMRCCMCESSGGLPPRPRHGQIHHIDSNPSNNDLDNLVWLCFDHHEDAGKQSPAARRMSPELVKRYRDTLEEKVRRNQSLKEGPGAHPRDEMFQAALDAQVVVEVGKIRYRMETRVDTRGGAIDATLAFPSSIGYHAREAIIELLDGIAADTRFGLKPDTARHVRHRILDLLTPSVYGGDWEDSPSKTDVALCMQAIGVGESMAYDGALYLKSPAITEAGCEILGRIMAIAERFELDDLRRRALAGFELAKDGATRSGMPILVELVTIFWHHSAEGRYRDPNLPPHLAEEIYAERGNNSVHHAAPGGG